VELIGDRNNGPWDGRAHFRHKAKQLNGNMKNKLLLINLLTATALALGCNQEPTTAQQLDKLKTETKVAAQDLKDYTFAQKGEFVAKMQSQLAEINRDLDQLSVKVQKSSAAAKAEAKPKLEALRAQVAKLNQQLDAARNADESAWDEVKSGFKKGFGELNDGFQQARQWVSDKIAP
jgi:polyhydroxyalkanoate synthesis regulator phasin